jgi:hypothetical protein
MDSLTQKVLIAIMERSWRNGYLVPLTKELFERGNVDKYLDKDFLKKYNDGDFKAKYFPEGK